jgi:hypothetical protein
MSDNGHDYFESMFGSMFGGPSAADLAPLDGLHVSRAGDFYWPSDGGTSRLPESAPALSPAQIRTRVSTGEIRRVA